MSEHTTGELGSQGSQFPVNGVFLLGKNRGSFDFPIRYNLLTFVVGVVGVKTCGSFRHATQRP